MMDDYLNGNIKDIIEPMISALLIAQPDDPKFFMLVWLKNLYSLDYIIINKEKEELENIKLEIQRLKQKQIDQKEQKEAILKKANSQVSKTVSENEKEKKSEYSKKKSKNNIEISSDKSISESSESASQNEQKNKNELNKNIEEKNKMDAITI